MYFKHNQNVTPHNLLMEDSQDAKIQFAFLEKLDNVFIQTSQHGVNVETLLMMLSLFNKNRKNIIKLFLKIFMVLNILPEI